MQPPVKEKRGKRHKGISRNLTDPKTVMEKFSQDGSEFE
jgi:hypothetical protein